MDDARQRAAGTQVGTLHPDDTTTRPGRRPAQCLCRQLRHERARRPHGDADWYRCRNLPGRIRALHQARRKRQVHQRHSSVRALDRHRSLRVRTHGATDGAFLGAGRSSRTVVHRAAGGRSNDRRDVAAHTFDHARGGACPGRAAMEGGPSGALPGRALGHHYRRSARDRPHLGRDGAAALHRAQQPILDEQPAAAHRQYSSRHFPVRPQPLRVLARVGVGRCLRGHDVGTRAGAGISFDSALRETP